MKGTLQQYAGPLQGEHAVNTAAPIIDNVDTGRPVLLRTWSKRQRGDKAMGYHGENNNNDFPLSIGTERVLSDDHDHP